MSTKHVLVDVLITNAYCQLLFVVQKNYVAMLLARVLSGTSQVFLTIYWPVWVGVFAETEAQ